MNIGLGLPASVPGVTGEMLLKWAKRAEDGPFSSLGIIDRVVYLNYEPLITLAAVAGATQRIRLMTTVLAAPLHGTALLAKQAASLDALSGGRLTLGMGLGTRADDYEAAGTAMQRRGKRFAQQLETMARIWSGERMSETVGPIGPTPVQSGGPEVLIGTFTEAGMKRVGHWNNGIITGHASYAQQRLPEFFKRAEQAWQDAGRVGRPRKVASVYFGLGPQAAEGVSETIAHYYAFGGASMVAFITGSIPTTPEAVHRLIEVCKEAQADELILQPCIAELDQISYLEEIIR